ncbi:MAG: tetratricopeptide repeat protein [Endomicrobiia bacterium]
MKIKNYLLFAICYLLFTTLAGCANYKFNKAKSLEKRGYYPQAIKYYLEFANQYKNHKLSAEAMYRAGKLYQKELKIYSEAKNIYFDLINKYPENKEFVRLAKIGIFNSPDYFPLEDGNIWVEGDSESGGKNMKVEWYCQEISTGVFKITKKYFAGKNLVTTLSKFYNEENFELRESSEPNFKQYSVLLRLPFNKDNSWQTERDNRKIKITIVATDAEVKTIAGEFKNCLKICYEDLNFPGSYKYEYYAIDVGPVLTTVSSIKTKIEHRNSELLYYKLK